jgi:HlyD family secretion protein
VIRLGRVSTSSFVAAVTILLACAGCKPGEAPARYEVVFATRADVAQHVTASGTLAALVSVDVGSQVSGKVARLSVDFNSPVRKGELIAEIDPSVYEAALRQAEGQLASAKANLVVKRQHLERKTVLVPLRAAAQLDLDQATADLLQADASVVVNQALLESAKANLGYCKITAPVDGIVVARKVDVGQTITAGFTTPLLFTIARDLSRMNISAYISEADIGQVKIGQAATFTVEAFPEDTFQGTVSQVRKSPTTTQNVVTYETIITVMNPGQRLFPGMTADVSILVAKREKALSLLNTALRYSPPEGVRFEQGVPKDFGRAQRLVYAVGARDASLRPLVVKAGITDGVRTEILDGLDERVPVVVRTLSINTKGGGLVPPPASSGVQ